MTYQLAQQRESSVNVHSQCVVHLPLVAIKSVQVISANELVAPYYQLWESLRVNTPQFDSPYYHPEFTRCVANIRDGARVALLKNDHEEIVGFLPYQVVSEGVGQVIGGRMSDFHGIVTDQNLDFDFKWLLGQMDLHRLDFHALHAQHKSFDRFAFETMPSHYIDLSGGIDEYLAWIKARSTTLKRMRQKARALRRDIGDVTFEFECQHPDVLEDLIETKREKFRRTNTFDILGVDWAANLLREVHNTKTPNFRGLLSVLRAGKETVASHFGMISGNVLHYWFPAFDTRFAKYSPGLQLMLQTCRVAHANGIKRIDMSYGDSAFKDKFCNGSTPVHFGSINLNPISFQVAQHRYHLRKRLKHIPLKATVKALLRSVYPDYGNWHFK